jgi:hypothetical protein
MQPKSLKQLFSTFLTATLFMLSCSSQKNMTLQSTDLSEKTDLIEMQGVDYRAVIDKENAILQIYNQSGKLYTRIPLAAQTAPTVSPLQSASRAWEISGKDVKLFYLEGPRKIQAVQINFFDDGFEIKFGIRFPVGEKTGIFCFKHGETGLDTEQWLDYFSPEADSYYDFPPEIDALANRDNQWIFCPAPLNLSFETPAGWFSVGLAALPPATQFSLKENALWLDYHWEKVARTNEELHWLVPFVFTFNHDEWKAVADYRKYLVNHNQLPVKPKGSVAASWWRQPLLSTWGEQTVLNIPGKNSEFNSEWVKQYVSRQMQNYPNTSFTIIIENQWQTAFGDCRPDFRFKDLKELIQWCHQQNHQVILWWKAWTAEANSLAQNMEITDGDFIDATHSNFESYVKHCCEFVLGAADTSLNADGLKIADTYLLRNPEKANYQDSTKGIGLQELYLYLKTFYHQAKQVKPDALILGFAEAPQFEDVQDMVSINEDWDNKLRREKRARIITQALPNTLINGDASDLSSKIALYHYVTSTIYATPEIEYLSQFPDKTITPEFHEILKKLLGFYEMKDSGRPEFVEYGWWQWRDGNKLIAESIANGTALLFYKNQSEALLFSTEDQDIPVLLEKSRLLGARDEKGENVEVHSLKNQIYKLRNIQKNQFYKLKLRPIPQ